MNPLDTPNVPFDAGSCDYTETVPRGLVIRSRAALHAAVDWFCDNGIHFVAKPHRQLIRAHEFLLEYDLPRHINDRDLVVVIMKATDDPPITIPGSLFRDSVITCESRGADSYRGMGSYVRIECPDLQQTQALHKAIVIAIQDANRTDQGPS